MNLRHVWIGGCTIGGCALLPLSSVAADEPAAAVLSPAQRVTAYYVEQAHTRYADALEAAHLLVDAVQAFLREPSAETQAEAKRVWTLAHGVYSHTEVFRFGNPNVDAWEGQVNAWPMDEGLIDYVAEGYIHHEGNPHALTNLVVEGRMPITDELIAEFQSGKDPKSAPLATTNMSDIESNVTRGFHAVEFLLWGQDLDRDGRTAGQRPHTDYLVGEDCTNGRCDRRRNYLSAATRLLTIDLEFMVRDWKPGGALYSQVYRELPVAEQLDRMLVGMGTLSFGELASERMQVALLTGDQEEEQSCFSDTTHLALGHNARSIETLYFGRHERLDGTVAAGPSLSELVASVDPDLDARMRRLLAETRERADALVRAGEEGEPFDQMIRPGNEAGHARIQALMDALARQTEALEDVRTLGPRLAAL